MLIKLKGYGNVLLSEARLLCENITLSEFCFPPRYEPIKI